MNKIFALITLYNPQLAVKNNILKLSKQVSKCFLLDNSNIFNEVFENIDKSLYIPNYKNLGISKAFNKVLKSEKFDNNDYLIFFDQDFEIQENYVQLLIKYFEQYEEEFYIGCFGPVIYDRNTNQNSMSRHYHTHLHGDISIVPRIITSSLLIRYDIIKRIGFWDENIFLDWSDFDLSYRVRKFGFNCAVTSKVVLNHQLGDNSKKIFGKEFTCYSPVREYYQVRDALRTAWKKTTPIKEKMGLFNVVSIRAIVHLFIFDKKLERLTFYIKAYRDFIFHRTGSYEK
jgi:rhamnosyltransferase